MSIRTCEKNLGDILSALTLNRNLKNFQFVFKETFRSLGGIIDLFSQEAWQGIRVEIDKYQGLDCQDVLTRLWAVLGEIAGSKNGIWLSCLVFSFEQRIIAIQPNEEKCRTSCPKKCLECENKDMPDCIIKCENACQSCHDSNKEIQIILLLHALIIQQVLNL